MEHAQVGKTTFFSKSFYVATIAAIGLGIGSISSAAGAEPSQDTATDLNGVVTSGGAPASKVTVLIYTAHPKSGPSAYCPSCYPDCSKRATTAADGSFHIPKLADWLKFRVLLVGSGYEPKFVGGVDPAKGHLDVDLQKRDSSADAQHIVVGRVTDAAGKPVIGASVSPVGIRQKDSVMMGAVPGVDPLAISDEEGAFRLHTDKVDGKLIVSVEARDLAPTIAEDLSPGQADPTRITLTTGAFITGYVRDEHGKGMPGIVIEARGMNHSASRFSQPIQMQIASTTDGRFTLSNVAAGVEYKVFARMESLNALGLATTVQGTMTDDDGSTTPDVNLIAQSGLSVTGRVVMSDGQPLPPDVHVILTRTEVGDSQFASIGADGRFTLTGVPRNENVTLALNANNFRLEPNVYTRTGVYLLRSSLDRGIRDFKLSVYPVADSKKQSP